jgi:UPF0755 protein
MLRYLWLVLLVVAIAAIVIGTGASYSLRPLKLAQAELEIVIPAGSNARMVGQTLAAGGLPIQPTVFVWLARLSGMAHKIKAGNYIFNDGQSLWQVLQKLVRGDVSQREFRFIEGWTFRQLRSALNQHPDLRHDTQRMSEAELLQALGAVENHPEGLFFPDTYLFNRQSSDLQILKRAYRVQQQHVARLWETRAANSPLNSPYQALILASIIEKETGQASDRGKIAGVFINRLRAGMLLQTDPTVIYGLGSGFDGNLRKRDLLQDTPYNTYTRLGLPPTPIAMPGLAALRAAMQPDATDALFFVARGDGSSEFSRTLDEHNRAVARYQLSGRAASRK